MASPRAPEERKLVTVLFADLVRSTELVVEHDAEDVRARVLVERALAMSEEMGATGWATEARIALG